MADDVSIVVRVRDATRAGIDAVNANLIRLVRSANSMDKEFGSWKSAAIALAPALVPIAAATAPIIAGAGAAAVAVGAFGAAVIPQIGTMKEAAKAEEKYAAVVDKKGATSKQAAQAEKLYLEAVQKMPPATREAAASLSVLQDSYGKWSDSLAGDTMPVVTKGIETLSAVFPKLTPLVRGASGELNRLVTIAAGGVNSHGFDQLITKLTVFATGSLKTMNDGLVHLMRTLNTDAIGGGFSEFMTYAKENGPLVADTVKKLAEALMHLLVAGSDVGVSMLTLVNAFAGLVAAVPTGLITTLMQIAIAFKAVKIAGAGLAVVGGGITALIGQITAMRTAMGAAAAGTSRFAAAWGGLAANWKTGIVVAGIALLVVGLKKLSDVGKSAPPDVDKMTTSLAQLGRTGRATGEAARVFGTDLDGLSEALRGLSRPSNLDKTQQFLTSLIGMDSTPVKRWKEDLDGADKALANLVKGGKGELAAAAFEAMSKNAEKNKMTIGELKERMDDYASALADQQLEQQLTAQSMGLFGEQAQQVKAKLDAQKQSTDGLRQAIQALNDVNRAGISGMIGFEAAIDSAAEAAKKNAGALKMHNGQLDLDSEKARNAATALNDLASKTDEAAASARDGGADWETVNRIYDRGRSKLEQYAVQMGLNRQEARRLADQIMQTPNKTARLRGNLEDLQNKLNSAKRQLSSVPDSRKAAVRAQISQLENAIAEARRRLNALDGKVVQTYIVATHVDGGGVVYHEGGNYAHGGIIGAAAGGPRSRRTLVGEHGPEILDLAPGSRVHSNPDTRRMLADGGGGGDRPVVLEIKSGGSALDDLLVEVLRHAVRLRGGDVQLVLGQG